MGDATARLGLLDLVFKPQAPAGQLHLRSKERVGLDGHECEGQRSRSWRLALSLGADLERTVEARPLDTLPRPLRPVLHVDVPTPDSLRICARVGRVIEAPRHGPTSAQTLRARRKRFASRPDSASCRSQIAVAGTISRPPRGRPFFSSHTTKTMPPAVYAT